MMLFDLKVMKYEIIKYKNYLPNKVVSQKEGASVYMVVLSFRREN